MEDFLSRAFLNKNEINKEKILLFSLFKIFRTEEEKRKKGVFLSHKHSDKELVYTIIDLFERFNIDVYIDWLDNDMPEVTNQITALKIKDKIKSSKKFILLATEGALNSKWCNWELGLGDAEKYMKHIAIIPVVETNNRTWIGNEYLQIYPVITINKDKKELYVEFQNKKELFTDWLKN
jgi:hypothetical protein